MNTDVHHVFEQVHLFHLKECQEIQKKQDFRTFISEFVQ